MIVRRGSTGGGGESCGGMNGIWSNVRTGGCSANSDEEEKSSFMGLTVRQTYTAWMVIAFVSMLMFQMCRVILSNRMSEARLFGVVFVLHG